jgi:hypothetical protein
LTDVLIRNVSDQALTRIDARAAAQGLSRTEYLRRQVEQEARRVTRDLTFRDFERLRALGADLGDPEVMAQAWG